ncbi:DUF302 domain-containing protein [Sphingobium amiense]|uniref:DUF302 domain-containing protein n=1 Tax=Sphingobium amiense TaxID=135719 RepID=UPI001E470938|nr:DUF302 domain-containing protein [Sphingobium amiense]
MSSSLDRVIFTSDLPYRELVPAFEAQLGRYDHPIGEQLVRDQATWSDAEATIGRMQGPHGMMIFFRIDLGPTASLKGQRRECTLYLIGNPLIATQIVAHDIRAGLLVPFGVQIYSDGGNAMISYNRPSSALASLGNAEIDKIGQGLDAKIETVIKAIV